MLTRLNLSMICIVLGLVGCAHIDFGGDGLTYFEPEPFMFVSTTKDCVTTATIVVIPVDKKAMTFHAGYGSSDLSVELSNGMIKSVGQKTDTKIPETLTSIASLATAASGFKSISGLGKQVICMPAATLYPLKSGLPDLRKPTIFPVKKEIVNLDAPSE